MMKQCTLLMAAIGLAAVQQLSAQSWNITGNSNATTSSKLGTTNSVPLRLFTNNSQRVTITADGKMGVNTTAPPGLFTVQSNGSVPNAKWAPTSTQPVFFGFSENLNADFSLAAASNDPKQRPLFFGKRSRGTLASPTAVKTDDFLTSMAIYAYDGSAFQIPATIDFYADGTPSSGKVPSRISFVTGNNASDRKERLKIGSNGDINMNAGQLFVQRSTGKVGIGIIAPEAALHIIGTDAVSLTNPGYLQLGSSTGFNIGMDYNQIQGRYNASTSDLYLNYAGGNVISGSYNNSSYGLVGYGAYGVYGIGSSAGGYFSSSTGRGVTAFSGLSNGQAVYGSINGGTGEAIHGDAYGSSDYGMYGYSSKYYGIVGITGNASSYAGFFQGNVYTTGTYTGSDEKLKQNITDVSTAMEIINQLKPKYYTFRQDGNYKLMNLPQGKHYGLMAQDIEKVLPDLVKETKFDVDRSKPAAQQTPPDPKSTSVQAAKAEVAKTGEVISFKAVNYTELIPIMIKGMQEMNTVSDGKQHQIDSLKNELALIHNEMAELKAMISGNLRETGIDAKRLPVSLFQNSPNPLDKFTSIRYNIPDGSRNAQLIVSDISGKKIKQIELGSSPAGVVNFDASALASGSYTYSIVVDGRIADTKKMVVAKMLK